MALNYLDLLNGVPRTSFSLDFLKISVGYDLPKDFIETGSEKVYIFVNFSNIAVYVAHENF